MMTARRGRESIKLPGPDASWGTIIGHLDHVVKLVGPDHVGLGSDFDGAGMPDGMEDCSKLPKLTKALLHKDYSDDNIRKILGLDLFRVMEQAERVAREMQVGIPKIDLPVHPPKGSHPTGRFLL